MKECYSSFHPPKKKGLKNVIFIGKLPFTEAVPGDFKISQEAEMGT